MPTKTYTVFYLQPTSGYRTTLRSNTLWSTLCWAISMLYDSSKVDSVIQGYEGDAPTGDAFCISSAFPYKDLEGHRLHYFPKPLFLKKIKENKKEESNDKKSDEKCKKTLADHKNESHKKKEAKKVIFYHQHIFEKTLETGLLPQLSKQEIDGIPERRGIMRTHNTIDRLTGSTLTLNSMGQLFHTVENYWRLKTDTSSLSTGLFFLVEGNTELIHEALRFLRHTGIGGDRTQGKGTFEITKSELSIAEPEEYNAYLTLSLFYPETNQHKALETADANRFFYKLENRGGQVSPEFITGGKHQKSKLPMFVEGSIFPQELFGNNRHPGSLPDAILGSSHPSRQYGHAFFLPIKIN